jgi:hypothetical protein
MRKFWSRHVGGVRVAAGMAVLAALFSAAATAQSTFTGPISPYYLSAYNSQTIYVVQGNAVIDTFPWASSNTYSSGMIAVSSFVESRGFGEMPNAGAEYTLAGVPTGALNPYVLPAGIASEVAYDGASDGQHNYYVQYYGIDTGGAYTENVYQTGLNWQNPAFLFSVQSSSGEQGEYLGIAYDSLNNSLWITGWQSGVVNDYSLSGTLLSSFPINTPGYLGALAYDRADNTLWGSYNEANSLYQYSTAGVLLQAGTPTGLVEGNYLGGDMSTGSGSGVPEPATTVLVVAGLAALVSLTSQVVRF